MGYAYTMAEERRRCPADDIVTRLIQADIDGESSGDVEFAFFVILLAVAGNETTRNAMTHGMNAFFDNPDQWELFKRERPDTAVDEIIRWATPVHCFQRTALADVEFGDVTIREGQRAGLFYSSANFDEEVFDRPFEFDITRNPNPHLAFGGNGAHFCIGANLARMEIKLIFNELADQTSGHRQTRRATTTSLRLDQRSQGVAGLLPVVPRGLATISSRAHPRLVGSRRPRQTRRRSRESSTLRARRSTSRGADFSIADIARTLGVTRQTVYRYFPSTEALLVAAAVQAADGFLDRLADHLPASPTRPTPSPKAIATALEWLPKDKHLGLLLAPGGPTHTVSVTSDVALQFAGDGAAGSTSIGLRPVSARANSTNSPSTCCASSSRSSSIRADHRGRATGCATICAVGWATPCPARTAGARPRRSAAVTGGSRTPTTPRG